MIEPRSPLAKSADAALRERGTTLAAWLRARRTEGAGLRATAALLNDELGWQQRPVSHQTIANWLADQRQDVA